jgi:methyl-accepting chemotaxis protein
MSTRTVGSLAGLRRSYAAKLMVALLAVVALTVTFGATIHIQTTNEIAADTEAELTEDASMQATALDTWVRNVEGGARMTSAHPTLQSGDEAAIRDHLQRVADAETLPVGVVAVHYYDRPSTTIVASSNPAMEGVNPGEQGAPFATSPPTFDGSDDVYISDPFEVPVVDFPVLAVMSPVQGTDGAVIYMVNLEARMQQFAASSGASAARVIDGGGQYIAHPDTDRILTDHEGSAASMSRMQSSPMYMEGGDVVMGSAPLATNDWVVMVHTPKSEAFALADSVTSKLTGLILLSVVSLGLIGVTVGSNTVISLRRLTARADEMADGNLDTSLDWNRRDEIGQLYGALASLRDSLSSSLAEAEAARNEAESARADAESTTRTLERTAGDYEDVMSEVADGDLTRRVDADRDSEAMAAIGHAFNGMVDQLEATLGDVAAFADHVANEAEEVRTSSREVRSASEDAADAVNEISDGAHRQTERLHDVADEVGTLSAGAEETAATVQQVATTAEEAAEAGADGRDAAEAALSEMDAIETATDDTVREMESLEAEMGEIGDIAELIADIAEQTNLLALNASIEAARTGAEGDGFAVVADEVKSLAEETRDAASEVEARVEELQARADETADGVRDTSARVDAGVETVEAAIEALERIARHAEETDESIGEIRDVTASQAESASAVVEMVDEVAAISEQTTEEAETVSAATEEQTATLHSVGDAVDDLAEGARDLRALIEEFRLDATETYDHDTPAVDAAADD